MDTPEKMKGLLPKQEVLATWQTVADARQWAGLSEEVAGQFLEYLGNRNMNNLPLLAAVTPAMVRKAIAEVRLPAATVEGEEGPPEARCCTPFEKTQLGLFFNAARARFDLDPVDVVGEQREQPTGQGPTGTAASAPNTAPLNPLHKVKLSSVLDQASDAEVQLLPPEVLADKRARYKDVQGGDPLERNNFTDAQLSALSQRVAGGGPPYADFAVWGPYGSRIEKKMKFRTSFLDTGGHWRTLEVPGPASFEVWEECWEVFKAAAIADNIAAPATLDIYASEFKERCRVYGAKVWHLCVEADVIARSEELVAEMRRQRATHAQSANHDFDEKRPWESVFRAVALNRSFWDRVLEKPALRGELSGQKPTPAFSGDHPAPTNKRPGGGGNGPTPKKRGKATPAEQRRPDGRYYRGRNGTEICFAWGRGADTCSEPCPHKRMHICEWCRNTHRSINCPSHPGWKPGGASNTRTA